MTQADVRWQQRFGNFRGVLRYHPACWRRSSAWRSWRVSEPNNCGLSAATLEILRRILRAEPAIERAILFVSGTMGTHEPGSDIDLALVGQVLYQRESRSDGFQAEGGGACGKGKRVTLYE